MIAGGFATPFSELFAMKPGGSLSVTMSDSGPISSCTLFVLLLVLLFFAAAAAFASTAAFVACFNASSFFFASSTSDEISSPELDESELELLSLETPELLLDTYAFFVAAARAGAGGLVLGFATRATGAFFFGAGAAFFLFAGADGGGGGGGGGFLPYVPSKSESSSGSESASWTAFGAPTAALPPFFLCFFAIAVLMDAADELELDDDDDDDDDESESDDPLDELLESSTYLPFISTAIMSVNAMLSRALNTSHSPSVSHAITTDSLSLSLSYEPHTHAGGKGVYEVPADRLARFCFCCWLRLCCSPSVRQV